jgi:predicted DNA-binding protein (MmcQ/YjbR family)
MNPTKAKAYCRKLPGATEDIKWETNLVLIQGL